MSSTRSHILGASTSLAILLLLSCSDKKSTDPDPDPDPVTVHAPWEDREAEEMAVIMGGELAASRELYEQVASDLDAIRSGWSGSIGALGGITHRPTWQTDRIEVAVDQQTYAEIAGGFPAGWDSLNQSLRIDRATRNDSTLSITLTFDAVLAPQQLARLYQSLDGVRWVRMIPGDFASGGAASVDGFADSAGARSYLFSLPPNGCGKLCDESDYWVFEVDGSNVDSLGSWTVGDPVNTNDSVTWWTRRNLIRNLALGPGSVGDFPDSDLVPPAVVGGLDGYSPDSRRLLIRWTAPGDDGAHGVASGYQVSVTGPNFLERLIDTETAPRRAGLAESLLVENLLPDLLYRIVIRAIDEQGNRSTWSGALNVRSLSPWSNFTAQNSGLSNNAINALALDQWDRLWCATEGGGINRFDGSSWDVIFTVAGHTVTACKSLEFDPRRSVVWCGLNDGALAGISTISTSHRGFNASSIGLGNTPIVAIETDNDGNLWCANASTGLARWDGSGWTQFSTASSGLAHNAVWSIATAPNGDLWFATSNGASRFDGTTWESFTKSNSGIGANLVRAVNVDVDGTVWLGHHDKSTGASTYSWGNWHTLSRADSLLSTFVNVIEFKSPGIAWLGTTLGLSYPGQFWQTYLTDNSPLIDNTINAMVFTSDTRLWIGTPKGLTRYEVPMIGR